MTSVPGHTKLRSVNNAYYVNVGSLKGLLLQNNATTDAPSFVSTTWLVPVLTTAALSSVSSAITTAGSAFLRDCGKTLVSSGRVFRKVQLLGASVSTGGVIGAAPGTLTDSNDYLTAYIELPGLDGIASGGTPAPVARVG
jgi:hypothetical protein